MISRTHGLVLSMLLGAASVTGAYAVINTAHLGDVQTKPEVVSSRQITKRARKLDAWEASLQKTLKARPPALPALHRYATLAVVTAPRATPLPGLTPVTRATVSRAKPAPKPRPTRTEKRAEKAIPAGASATRTVDDDAPERAAPVTVVAPVQSAAAPTPAPTVLNTPTAPAPATKSVEQQCRELLRAAEGKGEQAKQAAEKQCEALKQAAEKKDD